MRHAIIIDETVDVEGRVTVKEHHYLTCKECRLEEAANKLALKIAKLVYPADWPRFKYQIEQEILHTLIDVL